MFNIGLFCFNNNLNFSEIYLSSTSIDIFIDICEEKGAAVIRCCRHNIVSYIIPGENFINWSKSLTIKTKYIEGPLKNLNTIWNFIDLENNQSKVLFILEFEFSNYFHQKLAELFFPLIETKMMESFIQRADETLN